MNEEQSVLLVDNDQQCIETAQPALLAAGYRVRIARSAGEAIRTVHAERPTAIVVGLEGPVSEGQALIFALKATRETADIPTVWLGRCGFHQTDTLGQPAMRLAKPLQAGKLTEAVRQLIDEAPRTTGAAPSPHSENGTRHTEPVWHPLSFDAFERSVASKMNSATVRIQEEERRKLSLELHDDIAQIMGNLVLMIDSCITMAPGDATQLRRYLGNARSTAKEGFGRVQRFSLELRPPMLDDLGLAPTILWYAERYTRDTNIPVEVSIPGRLPSLNGEQETAVFRIVQEGLQNVRKHAKAQRATIALEARSGTLRLEIADDGVGFEPKDIERKLADGTHVGLAGIRYRAELLNGSCEVTGSAGNGTRIVVQIPLSSGG